MKRLVHRLRSDFLAGLLIVLPLAASVWLVWTVLSWAGGFLDEPVRAFTERYAGRWFRPLIIPGAKLVSLLILLAGIAILGALARNWLGRRLVGFGERLIVRVPLVGKVYTAVRQIAEALLGRKASYFSKVVVLEYPRKGLYTIGLVSATAEGEVQERTRGEVVNVFVPTTPNPTSGYLLLVPKEELTYLDMTVEEALKLIISGGILMPQGRRIVPAAGGTDDKDR